MEAKLDELLEAAYDLLRPSGKHSDPVSWEPRPMFFRSGRRWWRQDMDGNQAEAVDL